MDLQEQIRAYTAWINSQLKKRSQHINDLSLDLNDGVVLATVVEIVSGHKISAVKPTNDEEKRENLQKIINFMTNNGIKLHHVSIDEIIAGNVKSIMQLILALAAHFKPASIGGRKHNYSDKSHRSPVIQHRWKKDETCKEETKDSEKKLQMELETELSDVKSIAEKLQKLLLDEMAIQPIENPHPFEESSILQAKLDQADCENQKLQIELSELKSQLRSLAADKTVMESRIRHHEQDILSLKQDLLCADMEKDKLKSEKADLQAKLEDSFKQRDRLVKQVRKKDMLLQEMSDELHFVKTEELILLARKDREVAQLQKQINNTSNVKEQSVHDTSTKTVIKLSASPTLSHPPAYTTKHSSVQLSTRSLHKSVAQRKERQTQSEVGPTRVLYFNDRDMTPSMKTIAKRLGNITLKDFKDAIQKDGNFRYIFKTVDSELGTVKEEIFRDDDIVPGWDGKIVAWIEEEVRV